MQKGESFWVSVLQLSAISENCSKILQYKEIPDSEGNRRLVSLRCKFIDLGEIMQSVSTKSMWDQTGRMSKSLRVQRSKNQ